MSRKRSIILISIIAFLTVVFVIFSTVFRVSGQSVIFLGETNKFSEKEVVSSSEIKRGKTVFFINKSKVAAKIEEKLPYAKVEKIEIKFPNKVKYHISQRNEFCFALENGVYYVFDDELKLLRTSQEKPALIEITGMALTENEKIPGRFANENVLKLAFENFEKTFSLTKDGVVGPTFSLGKLKAILKFKKIDINQIENSLTFSVNEPENYSIKIAFDEKFQNKIAMLMGIVLENEGAPTLSPEDRVSGKTFEIKSTTSGLVFAEI